MKLTGRIMCLAVFLVFACILPPHLSLKAAEDSSGDAAAIDFDDDEDGLIVVPVFLFESWRSFILDTGADFTVVHSTFTNHLVQVSEGPVFSLDGPSKAVPFFKGIPIYAAKAWNFPNYVAGVDLTPLEEFIGRTIDGFLGADILTNYALLFDFQSKKILFQTNLPAPVRIGLPYTADENNHHAAFSAELRNGETIRLTIDTGFRGSLSLNAADWNKAFPNGVQKKKTSKRSDFQGKLSETVETRLPFLKVGDQIYTNLFCERILNTNMASFVGIDFLSDHRLTINFPDQRVHFRRVKYSGNESDEMTGMGIRWIRKSAIVFDIRPGASADRAGVKVGDEILRINGKRIWELKRAQIREFLNSNEGDVVELFLLRRDKPLTLRMRLKPEL